MVHSSWDTLYIYTGCPRRNVYKKLYINDLPKSISDTSNPLHFAENTSMTIIESDPHEFSNTVNNSIINFNSWFISNLLSLYIDKTLFLQFLMKNSKLTVLSISYENKHIMKVQKVKFLGLTIYNYLSQNFHIEEIIPKLNKACFTVRSVRPYLLYEVVRMIYFSYFHSILSYGIIFWGSSTPNNSIFKIQKRTIRVTVNSSY